MPSSDNVSIRNICLLPNLNKVYLYSQSLAMLDAILCPDWEDRYFSFDQHWHDNQAMASMRDGCGSEYFILFGHLNSLSEKYVIGKVYDYGLGETSPDMTSLLSVDEFAQFFYEPAFANDRATAYFYQLKNDKKWQITPSLSYIPFLGFIANQAITYISWAEKYYDLNISNSSKMTNVVLDVFNSKPLTFEMACTLNSEVDVDYLKEEVLVIGYPSDL